MNRSSLHSISFRLFLKVLSMVCLLAGNGYLAGAQEQAAMNQENMKEPLVNISGSMQFWARYTALNPGSVVGGQEKSAVTDFFIRRYRLRFTGMPVERFRYTFELGNNDLNAHSAGQGIPRLLDAYVDYQFQEYLAIGAGWHGWSGLSRYAAPSSTQALAYDIDFVAAPFVNVFDKVLRRPGAYVRGVLGGFDYRLVLVKPVPFESSPPPVSEAYAAFAGRRPEYQASAYFKYQFLERESQLSPYAPGTYLGEKNVLNIGAGFLRQPGTTWYLHQNDTILHTAASFSADLFFEKALPKKRGLSVYLAFIRHDLGPNFMRYMGPNNPASHSADQNIMNGGGNNSPVTGTGHIWYGQLAYIRQPAFLNGMKIQAFVSGAYGSFEAFSEVVLNYNAGINYYLNGHRSKITLGYQSRPVFRKEEHEVKQLMRKDMLVVQYQILFGG